MTERSEFEKRENEDTFQKYLERAAAKGEIDFSLRILRTLARASSSQIPRPVTRPGKA